MQMTVKLVLGVLVLLGAMYLFVFPARTYLAQKREIALQEQAIAVVKGENSKLSAEKAALHSDATIEQLARQDYGLVAPGQQAYMVLPSPAKPARVVAPKQESSPWYSPLEFWHYL